MTHEEEWFERTYDEVVGEEADGIELAKARHEVGLRYEAAVSDGELESNQRTRAEEGEQMFEYYITKRLRSKRKSAFRKELEYLLAALHDETIFGDADPRLDQSMPISDGRDKRLRYWTRDDWTDATTKRFQNSAAAVAAADEFSRIAQRVIGEMNSRGASMFGRMFEGDAA